jgi:hypothetical protein
MIPQKNFKQTHLIDFCHIKTAYNQKLTNLKYSRESQKLYLARNKQSANSRVLDNK